MKFNKIKYKNYRCFLNAEIDFNNSTDKNIVLIIAPNGGGKTEMLFSFWWVLYDFDFSSLSGKESAPYALNSDLYKDLEASSAGTKQFCQVVLEFEVDNKIYQITKTCNYVKENKKITETVTIELFTYNEYGEKSQPYTDKMEVEKKLSHLIPKTILHGIVFDGERMMKLSSLDDNSAVALEGVIKDITNVELYELIVQELSDIHKDNLISERKISTKNQLDNLTKLVNAIAEHSDRNNEIQKELEKNKRSINDSQRRINEISNYLSSVSSLRNVEMNKQRAMRELDKEKKKLKEKLDQFANSIANGYLILCDDLFETAIKNLDEYDAPRGLTVEAVKSIMLRETCICGACIDDEVRTKLANLLNTLPPDNINSTLQEMIRGLRESKKNSHKNLKIVCEDIKVINEEITQLKNDIAAYSSQLLESNNKKVEELERERNLLNQEIGKLNRDVEILENEYNKNKNSIERYTKEKESIESKSELLKVFKISNSFISKMLNAISKIKEKNELESLKNINKKILTAYATLSEDYIRGRRIYITMFKHDNKYSKYNMIAYSQNTFDKIKKQWEDEGKIEYYSTIGKTLDEIKETIIIKSAENNSTGQSKINAISFVKAILEYSMEIKDENSIENTREYPLLIDAPFGDLSEGNLYNASSQLSNFSKQVILMLSKDSYNSVKQQIDGKIFKKYFLIKNERESFSSISGE